ncbi:glycoside hydrolase family 25 protein [Corynebacterium sp. NPDC060344]|uniref:glycoside hydrolase family 25 protein n=1 Tax=Corynebacterium sp. NPDC060344 TaxID=3347101 RepID=UPI00364BDFA6
MNLRTATFPESLRRTRRGRAGALVALAAALPMALGLVAPAPADAFTATSPTGIDVSKWQRPGGIKLDWDKVAASGEKFAFIKATDGAEGLSPYFAEDSKAAHDAGLIIGSYHKAHPDRDAIIQADAYAQALKLQPAGSLALPPVLDLELDAGMTPAALEKWASAFMQRVELKTGTTPMIYTYRWFWVNKMGNSTALNGYPLWLAAYQDQPPTDVPGGWDEPLFWQRSSTGRVPGINTPVDLNTFNGTKAQLDGIARGDKPATTGTDTTDSTTDAEAAGARRATVEDDTGVGADAVSPPTGRAANGAGSLGTDAIIGGDRDGAGTDAGAGTGADAGAGEQAEVIGGDTTAPADSPLATSELVDAIIAAIEAGSDDGNGTDGTDGANGANGTDNAGSIAAVRSAAEAAGLDEDQIDTLIAFLERAIESGDVPEGQLGDIAETAPATDEADEVGEAGDDADSKPEQVQTLATYSDVVALLAGANR